MFHEVFPRCKDMALPQAEIRGGDFPCQIALKPFNNDKWRSDFKDLMVKQLTERGLDFDVTIGGRTTIDIQRPGMNKSKAIEFALGELKKQGIGPAQTIYFGDEFMPSGNDVKVAEMLEHSRPFKIYHVGDTRSTLTSIRDTLVLQGNGPRGTLNQLETIAAVSSS